MRLCHITTLYGCYLQSFYENRPGLRNAPYEVQHTALLEDSFGRIGALSAALPRYGYEVKEIVANARPEQYAWAGENGFRTPNREWVCSITLKQLEQWRPDVVFFDDPVTFSGEFIKDLRSRCRCIRMVLGFNGSPYYLLDSIRQYDVLLSPTKSWVASFEKQGFRCQQFAQAFNTSVLSDLPERTPVDEEVLFVGGLLRAKGYHLIRERVLEAIAKALPIRIHSPSAALSPVRDWLHTNIRRMVYDGLGLLRSCGVSSERLKTLPVVGRAGAWESRPMRQINPLLRPLLRPPLFGRALYRAQRKSAVTLNIHADIAGQMGGNNMRIFEATGVGTCLLTDANDNLRSVFEVDREVVAFGSPEECLEKARWLLDHPREREAIALAGQARTLRDHTYIKRAAELDLIIREFVGSESDS
jgi:hypothetical protein